MIDTLAGVAIFIFTVAGMTGATMVGADALNSKAVPKAVGVGILTASALLAATVFAWCVLSFVS